MKWLRQRLKRLLMLCIKYEFVKQSKTLRLLHAQGQYKILKSSWLLALFITLLGLRDHCYARTARTTKPAGNHFTH